MGEQDQSPHNFGDDGDPKAQYEAESFAKTDKIEAETGIDWIGALPDALIVQILSILPMTDACKTTILSKRWQCLWTCIDNLDFYSWKTGWSDNRFISFMDNALPLLTCSKIKRFTLHFKPNLDVSNYSPKLDKWLEIALEKKVEDLDLDVWHSLDFFGMYFDRDHYSLPQDLCSSSSVLKLKCQYCRIPEDRILNWTSLKSLTLTFVLLREEHIQQITSNCHQLESMNLGDFCGFHRLHLTSPKCRRLELINHRHPVDYMGGDCYFEIVAPYVQHLKISGDFDCVEIRLGDLSSLIHADLTFNFFDFRGLDEVIDKTIVKDHLTSVACAKELIIPSLYIEMISMSKLQKEDVLLPLLECKRLMINSWITKYTFLGIDRLLRSTPCLENLTILPKECCTFINYWCEDMDVLLGDKYENLFEGSLENVKTLKVIIQCSLWIYGMTEVTELMKSLLEHAKNLEKLVIALESSRYFTTSISKSIENLLALLRVPVSVVVSVESVAAVD